MESKVKKILVINPGSTSTKIAVYEGETPVFEENLFHDPEKIREFENLGAQLGYRKDTILEVVKSHNIDLKMMDGIVGRGGMVIELKGGGYKVTEKLCEALLSENIPQHASSLGGVIAYTLAEDLGIPAYIYDAPMGCELMPIATITGIQELEKYGCCHVLNMRAQGIEYAKNNNKNYSDLNVIVAHMGGGITVSAAKNGRIIDTASYDDGPMSPERSGGVPLLLFTKMCFNKGYTEEEVERKIVGKGGLYSYLGTTDCKKIVENIEAGDEYAALVFEAMAYQVAKGIADMTIALKGNVDVIILTGGLANSKLLTSTITDYAKHLGKIEIMPGENELEALAKGAIRMLEGNEEAQIF